MFLALLPGISRSADADKNFTTAEPAVRSFHAAVRDYYRVGEREIQTIRGHGISDEELPVIFFISERAHVDARRIVDLRAAHNMWTKLAFRFGLTPDVFYLPVSSDVIAPPYSKVYTRFRTTPKMEWKTISLSDRDVINLVNLRFISEYHKLTPEQVIDMRSRGKTFVQINKEIGGRISPSLSP